MNLNMTSRFDLVTLVCLVMVFCYSNPILAAPQGSLVDSSTDFLDLTTVHFIPTEVASFDTATGVGKLKWHRYRRAANLSFNKVDYAYERAESNEFPAKEYDRDPTLEFSITPVAPGTVRLRFAAQPSGLEADDSLMLAGPVPTDESWQVEENNEAIVYKSKAGEVRIKKQPWQIEFYDAEGKLLTSTRTLNAPPTFSAPTAFSFIRRSRDLGQSMAASFQLGHDEMIFGCGESFTRLDKRGQKVVLYLRDAMGALSKRMYKPIPFFLSSRGYGMFVHTSTPTTFDFGNDFDQAMVLYTGDDVLDIFVFLGNPKEVVSQYTAITGRSPMPPLWSFGLWMSRITYKSEAEVRQVANKLRDYRIPCDVIHLDTGWFETDWQCNYKFSHERFEDAEKMIRDLKEDGFHISLWQLPYFSNKNELFGPIVANGYAVRSDGGPRPNLDAVLDFSNPETVEWYQDLIRDLLELGVGAIKVDFGEDAPIGGIYASGRTGWYEHNLYPLRYNKTVAEITKATTGDDIIWARSAWAGSQRYPLHWGGDAENSDVAMAATLRGGLSLGLCGFTYWSHDAGGFVGKPSVDLYRRWLAFSALSSHTRCHGFPPREPWEYGEGFLDDFRKLIELRYALIPYIYSQAVKASKLGHPLLRPLFFEFPQDRNSWFIEDQYLLGVDLLVAPLFSSASERQVYLPPGDWVDYQTGKVLAGQQWHTIKGAPLPVVLLVRGGAIIPHAKVAQSTKDIDWNVLELRAFGDPGLESEVKIALPDGFVHTVQLSHGQEGTEVVKASNDSAVQWIPSVFSEGWGGPPQAMRGATTDTSKTSLKTNTASH